MPDITTPPEQGATSDAPPPDPFKWDDERKRKWQDRIQKAEAKQKQYHRWWERALEVYAPKVTENPEEYQLRVRSNRAFRNVERKIAELFYQRPEVSVAPSPIIEQLPNAAVVTSAHAAIMNEKLGPDGADALYIVRRAVFDYELFGAGWVKAGYRAHTVDTPKAVPVLDEAGQPVPDAMGQPQMTIDVVPVPIKTECFLENLSTKAMLTPAEFDSTEFDKSPWLGMRFRMPFSEAKRMPGWKFKEGWKPGGSGGRDNDLKFDQGVQPSEPETDEIQGTEIYYKSSIYRDDVVHPDRLTKLVLVDGHDDPVEWRDDPDQTVDGQGGLTPDSRIGYPYHPLVIRMLTDSAYVMSDVAIGMPQIQEMDKHREQMSIQRDINITRYYYNTEDLTEEEHSKALRAPQGGGVGLSAKAFNSPSGPIRPFPQFSMSPDDHVSAQTMSSDYDQQFAIDATGAGALDPTKATATEHNLRQANANVRQGSEQACVASWYIKLVTKFSTLIQKYFQIDDAAKIVGMQTAMQWDQWRKQLPTRLAFTMEPDSSLRNDTPLERMQLQQFYTYAANSGLINQKYLLEKLCYKFHLDPSKALVQPPPQKPPPPSISLSIKSESLSPLAPESPILLEVLTQYGIQISPEAVKNAMLLGQMAMAAQAEAAAIKAASKGGEQPKHGGKVPEVESLDKHAAEDTGGMQGSGAMMPGMAGGMPGTGVVQ